jgi:hypothetical protein
MTATEMGIQFKRELNQAHNQEVMSQDIAAWLTQAQQVFYNELFYNERRKGQGEGRPPSSFQDTGYVAEALSRFERVTDVSTTSKGFFFDSDVDSLLNRYTAIYVAKLDGDCEAGGEVLYDARYMRDNYYASRSTNTFEKPTWEEPGLADFEQHNVYYVFDNIQNPASGNVERGVRLLPKRKYNKVRVEYIINPPAIKIKNDGGFFGFEGNVYAANPDLIITTADVDALFPPDMHDSIVQEALALFLKSQPDYEGYQMEQQAINRGQS